MIRFLPVWFLMTCAIPGLAQSPETARFQWKPGQVLIYTVQQRTRVIETTRAEETAATGETSTRLDLTRKWTVAEVDANGVATLSMSISEMKQEIIRPGPKGKDGKPTTQTITIDSSTPEGAKLTEQYINKPIVTINLDRRGQLLDAKATTGSVARLQSELPFRLVLPEQPTKVGDSWTRDFEITLDPPLGTGEKYQARQTYTLKDGATAGWSVAVATVLLSEPKDAAELPALVPLLWKGEVTFDPSTGSFQSAKLSVNRDVAGHQGEGTNFHYESEYVETLLK